MNTQQQPPSAGGDPDEVLPSLPLALPEETEPHRAGPYGDLAPPYTVAPWQGPADHEEPEARPLNRPVRWLIACVEVAFVVGFGLLAAWAWDRATVPVRLPDYENPAIPDVVDRQSGPWTAAAVGLGLLAALLLMDAVRQAILALRLRDRPAPTESATESTDSADEPAAESTGEPVERD